MESINQEKINNMIEDVVVENLISKFNIISNCKRLWDSEKFYDNTHADYMHRYAQINTRKLFNIGELRKIMDVMDYKTFIHMCKYVKEDYESYEDGETVFFDMFNMDANTETEIIYNYAIGYITNVIVYNSLKHPIINVYRNIFKIKEHNNKHNKLINLYVKLDKKYKQKKTINRILSDKFDEDMLDIILYFY